MTRPHFRLPAYLRASLLVLLVLGLVAKPVLSQVGDLHAAEHALLADADGHGHDHGDDHDEDEPGTDHTQGAHGLMHQAAGGASSEQTAELALPVAGLSPSALPPASAADAPTGRPSTPFRPPIA